MKSNLIISIVVFSMMLAACSKSQEQQEELPTTSKEYSRVDAAIYNTQLGLAYLKQGNRPRAKKKLLVALSQAPDSPNVIGAMAYFLEKTGDIDDANKYYQKAMKLAPGNGAQLNNYGAFLCRQGDYKMAELYFNKAVRDVKYENTAGAYENAGLCALQMNETQKAEKYFSRALENDSSRKISLYELARLQMKQQHYQKVLDNLQRYPKIALKNESLLKIASSAANKLGKHQLASRYLTALQQLDNYTERGANNEYERIS